MSSGVSAERSPWEGLGGGSWARYLRLRQWGPPFWGCAGRGSMGILMTEGGGNWGRNGEILGEGSTWWGSETAWSSQRDPKPPEEEEEALPSSSQIPGLELHTGFERWVPCPKWGIWALLPEDFLFFAVIFLLLGTFSGASCQPLSPSLSRVCPCTGRAPGIPDLHPKPRGSSGNSPSPALGCPHPW